MSQKTTSTTGKMISGVGLLLITLGLVCNEWFIVRFFSDDGALETSTRVVLWSLDTLMILAGLLVLKYREKLSTSGFFDGDKFLKVILAGGTLLRIIVYVFQQPHNNDNHFGVVSFVAKNGAFPTPDLLGQAYQPPLYYFLAAPLAVLGSAKLVQLLSLFFSIANLGLLYHLIKTTRLLHDLNARRHVLLFAAMLPQFVLFSNYVSNDSLSFLLGTLIFIQAFRYIEQPGRRNLLLLALALGIGLMAKGTFLAFFPVILAIVLGIQIYQKAKAKQQMVTVGMFVGVVLVLGSYKYIDNTLTYGHPFVGRDEMGHEWVARQQGTYQGLNSILDVNVLKLVRHPSLSQDLKHSVPLLMYATFWYSYIPESNFQATRRYYPLNLVPKTIYLLGVGPTLLMMFGAAVCFWRNKSVLNLFKCEDAAFRARLREVLIFLTSLAILAVVVIWGLKHDAWAFFQGRMLFPAFFAIAVFLGIGYEALRNWRPTVGKIAHGLLLLTYAVLGSYFIAEIGNRLA